jgi:hypothetical protein
LHGGTRDAINAKLANFGMPALRSSTDLPENPLIKVFWNPQGFGSPDLRKNARTPITPATTTSTSWATISTTSTSGHSGTRTSRSSNRIPASPYAIGEWGLWGIDDPAFVRRMANFVSTHPRVEAIVFFKSERGSIFDLATKPKSLAAYKRYIVPLGN